MNAKLLEIVLNCLTDRPLKMKGSRPALAACQGDAALQTWLTESVAPTLEGKTGQLETGPGVYLQSTPVQAPCSAQPANLPKRALDRPKPTKGRKIGQETSREGEK